ncbi:MAG TPA: sugar kinase [Armatimonadota bacterium]|jgi:sugar/nucleoside kinase (ribokinase family)
MAEVVCLGILVADVWARPVDRWPEHGRLGVVGQTGLSLGGCAANTGTDLQRLGVSVAVQGCVGEDGFGDFVTDSLRQDGIDVSGIYRTRAAGTSTTMIMIDSAGERTYLHCFGANGHLDPARLDMAAIKSAKLLHLAGVLLMPGFDGEPQAQVLAAAQAAGVTTCVDTAWDDTGRWMQTVAPLLPHVDLFLPSLPEAQKLTGRDCPEEMARVLLDAGAGLVGIKLGPDGSYVRTADAELRMPAYRVHVVDGSGAGDAFVAGFLYGHLHNWDLERTLRFANAVGALATTAAGTTTAVRDYDQVIELLETHEPGQWAGR